MRRGIRRRIRGAAMVAVVALSAAACGTTVQVGSAPNGATGDALSAPGVTSSSGLSGPTSGVVAPGGSSSTVGGNSGSSAVASGSGSATSRGEVGVLPPGGSTTGSVSTSGPIQLGFIVTNASNAGQFVVNAGQTYSDQQLYDALVAAMNKRGGIDGRKIKAVYGVTDTASASWVSDFQAACANFTQDHHVAAVVGYIFVFIDSFESCLAKAGVPHLYGGYQPGDIMQQRKYPTLVSTTSPTSDGHWKIGIGGAISSGVLTPKNKLGVIVDTCANDDAAFNRVGAPLLKANHITYQTFKAECSQGASDDSSAVSEVQSAELQFRADGVDTVYVEGVPALLFAEDAESQHWYPSYLMSPAGAAFEGNVPNDQLQNFHGFGVIPSVDVDPLHQPYKWNASERRCLDMLKSEGLQPKGYNDYFEAFTTCDGLFLYDAAVRAAGGQTEAGPVVSALASVFGKTLLASTYGGVGRFTAEQHGGPGVWRQWGFAKSCSCFQYFGPTHAIT